MVSLFAFVITAYGMTPYLVASFNSGLACETAKSSITAAALEQTVSGTSTYAMAPRHMKCIATPGLIAGSASRLPPPEVSLPPKAAPAPAPAPARRSGNRR